MPPKPKFQEGERILAFHGPLLYEAKCVKSEIVKEKSVKYFIHYNGWNKNWDEWVPENRILKFDSESQKKQKELQKAHSNKVKAQGGPGKKGRPPRTLAEKQEEKDRRERGEKSDRAERALERAEKDRASTPTPDTPLGSGSNRGKSRTSTPAPGSSAGSIISVSASDSLEPPKKKRARTDNPGDSEEGFLSRLEVKIKIPEELKPWLVDDWDLITKQKKLLQLPCRLSAAQVLDDWVTFKSSRPNYQHKEAIKEVAEGLKDYFNNMLGIQLLYKWERPQYGEVLVEHSDKPLCTIYGGIHLLRLFVKLGTMLGYTPLDDKSMTTLCGHIQDCLKYMVRVCPDILSTADYMVAPPEYHRKSL